GSEAKREEGIEYFKSIFKVAQWLGARVLVYGSPKNRKGIDQTDPAIMEMATRYFKRLGKMAQAHDTRLCIEPLPPSYPCDFVTNSAEARQFIDRVNEKGFGLHLDASSLFMGRENVPEALQAAQGRIEHFHLSEPSLAPVVPESPVPLADYLSLLDQ